MTTKHAANPKTSASCIVTKDLCSEHGEALEPTPLAIACDLCFAESQWYAPPLRVVSETNPAFITYGSLN